MAATANLTRQWKAALFHHLMRLPLSFSERRYVGDLASRFNSIDTIQKTLGTTSTGLVDGAMAVLLIVMMFVYSSFLAILAVGMAAIYAAIRGVAYLDEENERLINDAIRALTISRVIIAHRRSTLKMADRVFPLRPTSATAIRRAG
jgi:ABC-type bacteriocin/lantibiotic exporter with double-glycine peptidase domain